MANNYVQFSEMIEDIPSEGVKWLREVLMLDPDDKDYSHGRHCALLGIESEDTEPFESWPGFGWNFEGDSLWLYTMEGADFLALEYLVKALIRKFMSDLIFSVTYAETCSKPRIGEFSGGWLVISKDATEGGNSSFNAEDAIKKLRTQREAASLLDKMEERFNGSDLDSHVHELKSQEAADIDEGGVRKQLEYLLEKGGITWMQALLGVE